MTPNAPADSQARLRFALEGLFCSQMKREYAFVVTTEEEKCTEDQESDLQNSALKNRVLMEVIAP